MLRRREILLAQHRGQFCQPLLVCGEFFELLGFRAGQLSRLLSPGFQHRCLKVQILLPGLQQPQLTPYSIGISLVAIRPAAGSGRTGWRLPRRGLLSQRVDHLYQSDQYFLLNVF